MQDRYAAAAPYTHTIFALMAAAGLLALLIAARAEWRTFARDGLGRGWWTMRLLMPLMFVLGGVVAAFVAKQALGSDGLILAYLGVFVVALPLWFVLHVVVGRLLRPALDSRHALWLAASPIGAALALSLVGHALQPLAWQVGMMLAARLGRSSTALAVPMRPIFCTLALAALAACAASPNNMPAEPPAPPVSRDVHGAWVIEQARTEPMLDKRRARLVLGTDGRLSGHTSCNAMNGPYTLQGDKIQIGAVATTRMACGPLLLEQEDRILTALELAATARVRPDGLLELRDADGRGVLRATRAPEQP